MNLATISNMTMAIENFPFEEEDHDRLDEMGTKFPKADLIFYK